MSTKSVFGIVCLASLVYSVVTYTPYIVQRPSPVQATPEPRPLRATLGSKGKGSKGSEATPTPVQATPTLAARPVSPRPVQATPTLPLSRTEKIERANLISIDNPTPILVYTPVQRTVKGSSVHYPTPTPVQGKGWSVTGSRRVLPLFVVKGRASNAHNTGKGKGK